jgi:hypothetical protein
MMPLVSCPELANVSCHHDPPPPPPPPPEKPLNPLPPVPDAWLAIQVFMFVAKWCIAEK